MLRELITGMSEVREPVDQERVEAFLPQHLNESLCEGVPVRRFETVPLSFHSLAFQLLYEAGCDFPIPVALHDSDVQNPTTGFQNERLRRSETHWSLG